MRIDRLLPLLLAAALLIVRPASAQEAPKGDPAKGASLLSDARKALGGEDRLASIARLQMSGQFRRAQGSNTQDGDFEIQIATPDKYKRTDDTGIAGGPETERVQGLNGTEIWDENSGGFPGGFGGRGFRGGFGGRRGGDQPGANAPAGGAGRGQFDPERLREFQRRQRQADLDRLLIVTLLSSTAPVAWIGTAHSPDGTADVLEFRPQDGTPTRLFLDSTSHMPLMISWEGPARGAGRGRFGRNGGAVARGGNGGADAAGRGAPDGDAASPPAGPPQPTTIAMYLSDYRTVNGIKLPHLIRRGANGQTQEEMRVKNYKLNPNFKSNSFDKPK